MRFFGFLFALSSAVLLNSLDAKAAQYSFSTSSGFRYAHHVQGNNRPASERLEAELVQKAQFTPNLTGVFAGRGWLEMVYAQQPDIYPQQLRNEDSYDIRLMDFYVQRNTDHLLLRIGQQTVVWSETFGMPNADIVNPKDFRDGGLGTLRSLRLPIPMVNAQVIYDNFKLQGLFIPKPYFHLLPLPGSPFSFPSPPELSPGETIVNREESRALELKSSEVGLRSGAVLAGVDLSVFYMNYFDRFPTYRLDPSSTLPLKAVINETHLRVSTFGVTATKEIGGKILRFELMSTLDRKRLALENGQPVEKTTDEVVYAAGVDFPTMGKVNFGLQWSQSAFSESAKYFDRLQTQSVASLHLQRQMFSSHDLSLIYAYQVSDGGQKLGVEYTIPHTQNIETRWGVDLLGGPPDSEFGRYEDASRLYFLFRYFFKS